MLKDDILYCEKMLPQVSRTFAPTIRLLPKPLNLYVTVAYLLCRIADTVEDSSTLAIGQKKEMLQIYAQIFQTEDESKEECFFEQIKTIPVQSADDELAQNLKRVLNVYYSFSVTMQHFIGKWVVEMTSGMQKFAQSAHKNPFSFLHSINDLDEYMYYVAGTVGYLLTEIFSYYSAKITPALKERLEQFAEPFGKGLQMVNIIRDMNGDLKRGQSYIPDELLKKYHLTRQSIFEQENADRVQALFNELIGKAVNYLDKALNYILLIPKKEKRIRLFCILPVFWAMRTLQKIQENSLALLGSEKIKISHSLIRREYFLALINMRSNRLMQRHYMRIRREFKQYVPVIASV